jgi:lysophospholipase L1-like esterase
MPRIRPGAAKAAAPVPSGNIVSVIGDSIAPPRDNVGTYRAGSGQVDYLTYAHYLSGGQLLFGKGAGVAGNSASQMLARIDADLLTAAMPSHWVLIGTVGTNDAASGVTPATFATHIRGMVAKILAAGRQPILTTTPPISGSDANKARADGYRRFVTAYAAQNGWPLVDFYKALADPATGDMLPAYNTLNLNGTGGVGDGIHPNWDGRRAMGQVLADTMKPRLVPLDVPLPLTTARAASSNLLENGLFRVDTNADGVPDGWTRSGAGTATVSLATEEGVTGRALRLVGGTGATTISSGTLSAATGGSRLAFVGRFRHNGAGTVTLNLNAWVPSGPSVFTIRPLWGWVHAQPLGWSTFYYEGTLPADATAAKVDVFIEAAATGMDFAVSQLGLYNLTALGIAA